MVIDVDGHLFETEEVFEKYMEPVLKKYRPRLIADDEGHNFWVVDGLTHYVERMDDHSNNPRDNAQQLIDRPPSDYLNSGRIFIGCEGDEPSLPRVMGEIGENKLIYSSDYPHADRSEGTVRFLQGRNDLSGSAKQGMLEENARRFYGF